VKEFMSDPDIRALLQELETLVERRNVTLDEAMRSVKNELRGMDQDKLIIDGLGAQKKFKRWYDAEFLSNTLPSAQADLVLTEKVVYELNQELLEQLTRQGEVDGRIVQNAYREEEQAPAALPGSPKAYILPLLPVNDGQ
jgi:transposase